MQNKQDNNNNAIIWGMTNLQYLSCTTLPPPTQVSVIFTIHSYAFVTGAPINFWCNTSNRTWEHLLSKRVKLQVFKRALWTSGIKSVLWQRPETTHIIIFTYAICCLHVFHFLVFPLYWTFYKDIKNLWCFSKKKKKRRIY